MITAEAVAVRAGPRLLLDRVSVALVPGEVLAVVGPNGAGKSTLLRVLAGERQPDAGRVTMDGRGLMSWQPAALARRRAVVSQHVALAFPMTAAAVVALGRLPWHATPQAARDEEAVAAALAAAGITHLAGRAHATLSGGERQRVHLSRALAQLDGADRPAALLLDEPTASLDVRHAAGLLHELRRLAGAGLAVMVVLHDLNEAAFVADRVAILAHGRCIAQGPKAAVLRPGLLAEVYGVPFRQADGALLPAYGLQALG
jgi:iron complex transport system ATP-binding protein